MMDYYGSIIKSEAEVDQGLIQKFREKCYESYMKKIIRDLREEEVLQKEYSVSGGWYFMVKRFMKLLKKQLIIKNKRMKRK